MGFKFYVAGVQHHEYHEVADKIEPGMTLVLEREPTNRFDVNAVKILWEGIMLGYVPKKYSQFVAEDLDTGRPLLCTVVSADDTAPNGRQIEADLVVKG